MKKKSNFTFILLLILCFVAYGLIYMYEFNKNGRPPDETNSFVEFKRKMPAPIKIYQIRHNNQFFYLWLGKPNLTFRLPKGPPAYIFDSNGILLDWISESYAPTEFNKKWMNINDKKEMTVREVEQILMSCQP